MIINHLSREMGARRLTIQQVAKASGLAYSTVLDLYHDRAKRMDWRTLDAICKAIGVESLGELFEYRPDVPDD